MKNIQQKSSLFIKPGSIASFSKYVHANNYSSIITLVDENTEKHCLPILESFIKSDSTIKIKSGEKNKTLHTCMNVWKKFAELNTDRKALLINLGGGVICDMGGFIAATYKRGIDFIHIPTTLLSMCDACIGGKLAIDLDNQKNMIGLFKNPKAILIYPEFLSTLPKRHLASGFAEIIKHALIWNKPLFIKMLKLNEISENIEKLIALSVKIKTSIVNIDPHEKGIRKALNFGHSIGHALETLSLRNDGENYLYHGEAVAAGMIAESHISYKRTLISDNELGLINKLILTHFRRIKIHRKNFDTIVTLILQDKKNENKQKLFTLLEGIGNVKINETVSDKEIKESLEYYNKLQD